MSDIADKIKKIVVEHLGIEESKVLMLKFLKMLRKRL